MENKYSREIEILSLIEPLDKRALEAAKKHWLRVVKPLFSLGKLEDMISRIAGIKGEVHYSIDKKALVIMCADNGVVEEGISQSGQEVTAVVTSSFLKGETSVCLMAKRALCHIYPVDIGIATDIEGLTDPESKVCRGTGNIALGPAMSRKEAIRAINIGINKVRLLKEEGYGLIATGEMGIGNTTTSSALASVFLGLSPKEVTGRGAGLSGEALDKKIRVIERAISVNRPDPEDAIDALSKLGGLDIAGLCGVCLGGAIYRVPIVLDGFIAAVSALTAYRICPLAKEYMIASHVSKEPAGKMLLDALSLSPVIYGDMCLGEGTGAMAFLPMLDMAHDIYEELPLFDNWEGGEAYQVFE